MDDRSGIRRSYRKTIYTAALIFVVALAGTVGLAQGEGLLRWLFAGFGGLLAVVAMIVAAGGLFVLRREADQERGKGWFPRSIDPPSLTGGPPDGENCGSATGWRCDPHRRSSLPSTPRALSTRYRSCQRCWGIVGSALS